MKIENVPGCSSDYGILVVESSHAKAVDGVNLATTAAAAGTAFRVFTHLDYESWLCLKRGCSENDDQSVIKRDSPVIS